MTSEITNGRASRDAGSASEITNKVTKRGPGARPTTLPGEFTKIIEDYAAALADTESGANRGRQGVPAVSVVVSAEVE